MASKPKTTRARKPAEKPTEATTEATETPVTPEVPDQNTTPETVPVDDTGTPENAPENAPENGDVSETPTFGAPDKTETPKPITIDPDAPVLKFAKMDRRAVIPKYQTVGAAGMDVHAVGEYNMAKQGQRHMVKTGLRVIVPEGYELQVRPRSGLAIKHGITVVNSPGTIDSDYRGEVMVGLVNTSTNRLMIKNGDRVAQLVLKKVPQARVVEVDESEILEDITARGDGGIGSTGK